jgi:hypothetical protein
MNRISSLLLLGCLASVTDLHAATTNFFTGFETGEGYSVNSALAGSHGWVGTLAKSGLATNAGVGGNGVTNIFTIQGLPATATNGFTGQQGYVGASAVGGTYTNLTLWQAMAPVSANATNVTFSTRIEILDGTGAGGGTNYDTFVWKVFNSQSNLLVALRFDETTGYLSYWLSASNAWFTSQFYSGQQSYGLTLTMNPASNLWSATLTGADIPAFVVNKPMAPVGTDLSVASVVAAWDLTTPGSPGDNCMLFDNFLITSAVGTAPTPTRPQVAVRSVSPLTGTVVRLTGDNGYKFALDTTTNLSPATWTGLVTNTVTTNYFDYNDSGAVGQPRRWYRGRWVP